MCPIDNLGNARAKSIDASGSMGNVTADLGGEWRPGSEAELSFTQSMGEVRVKVPTKVRLEADVRDSEGQKANVRGDAESDHGSESAAAPGAGVHVDGREPRDPHIR